MVSFLPVISVLLLTTIRAASQVASPFWRVRSSSSFTLQWKLIYIRGAQQPNITTLRAERVRLAGVALDTALDRLGVD
jgi:hypothetical protein